MSGPQEVTIRGKTYPSLAAAARDLGVTENTISMANMRGTLDYVGQGSRTPVQIGEQVYPSIKAAAAAFGVTRKAISYRMNNGTLDELLKQEVGK